MQVLSIICVGICLLASDTIASPLYRQPFGYWFTMRPVPVLPNHNTRDIPLFTIDQGTMETAENPVKGVEKMGSFSTTKAIGDVEKTLGAAEDALKSVQTSALSNSTQALGDAVKILDGVLYGAEDVLKVASDKHTDPFKNLLNSCWLSKDLRDSKCYELQFPNMFGGKLEKIFPGKKEVGSS